MRYMMTLVLAAGLAAPTANACDGSKRGDTTASAASACAGKMAAAGKACCRSKMAPGATTAGAVPELAAGVVAVSTKEGAANAVPAKDCPHSKKAGAMAEGSNCPLAKLRDAAGHGCAMSEATLKAAREVRASGKVLCAACDLKKSDACASVFQAANGKETYTLCGEGVSQQLLKLTKHGEVDVTVHGRVIKPEGGAEVLCLEGFAIGTI